MSLVVDRLPPPDRPCRLLAFDTSTERMSVAVTSPEGVFLRESDGGAQASTALIPDLMALLAEAGTSLQALDAIAYGCGPGAFTGLRTACSVAQGLGLGAIKPVLPVDSLLLVAESVRSAAGEAGAATVWVAQDARMDEVYAAAYQWQGQRVGYWHKRVAPALYSIAGLHARWAQETAAAEQGGRVPPRLAVTGSALQALGERLNPGGMLSLDASAPGARVAALARLAQGLWEDGALLDASYALPVYLRNKVAQTSVEREAIRLAKAGA